MKKNMNEEFGFGGMFVIDAISQNNANKLMEEMQDHNLGYLAVSLGFYKTLFSAPGLSTSSEIPEEERKKLVFQMVFVRVSIGLDNNIKRTFSKNVRLF